MSRINLFWSKSNKGSGNFGDELGPFIIRKLSGLEIDFVQFVKYDLRSTILFFLGLVKRNYNWDDFKSFINCFFTKDVLISVGSVLSAYNKRSVTIWGAGIMFENATVHPAKFLAVRGRYTQNRLKEYGYVVPCSIGDPGLLLPLIIDPHDQIHNLGIVPHHIHYDEIQSLFAQEGVLIINLSNDVETVVSEITSCRYIISTSLHGLIVAHAYNIPALWVSLSKTKLFGDNVKFRDYFSSIDVKEYDAFNINLESFEEDEIINLIIEESDKTLIQNDLRSIQQGLLNSAPFDCLPNYRIEE